MDTKETIQQLLNELNGGNATHEEKMAYLEELNQGIDAMHIILDGVKEKQIRERIGE